jgi:uncharacterized protein involved in exopolysaccharide biosynthesis
MKAFKEQIETLKQELADEKKLCKDTKRQLEEKSSQIDATTTSSRKERTRKER